MVAKYKKVFSKDGNATSEMYYTRSISYFNLKDNMSTIRLFQ